MNKDKSNYHDSVAWEKQDFKPIVIDDSTQESFDKSMEALVDLIIEKSEEIQNTKQAPRQ